MPTRNVVLTDRQADMVERLVRQGRYQNASEVLREGLRLLEQRDAEDEARLAALRKAAQIGFDDFAAGGYRTFATREALKFRGHNTKLTRPSGIRRMRVESYVPGIPRAIACSSTRRGV